MRLAALLAIAVVGVKAVDYDSSLNMTIDPNTVDESTRASWCRAQSDSCTILCDKDDIENDCDYTDLSYNCTCGSNNSAPALQYYQQTLPTFICTQLFETCISTNTGNATGQEACTDDIGDLCGTVPPSKAPASSSTASSSSAESTPSATKTSDSSSTSSTSTSTSDSSDDGDSAATTAGPRGLLTIAVAGVAAGLVAVLV
ncbi:hypothetical protein GMORB2_7517 [Geosmithia morbida]|uniref:DUF7707 domain-containing protein n=1 Tax=Geosmithia morbida TaxID=1094350 RepID=A0A9P5D475_9HYPO|nr:uncharacterized protein GMORB2_7517 [Geosmithia morbida]KAF4122525.1 hypothetical protein GMORB2_7517 [Geosmithia morbida]